MASTINESDSIHFPFLLSNAHWNIYLNFRGRDTRHNFTLRLYNALVTARLRTCMDDSGLQKGEKISPKVEKIIKKSDISILVFSKNYASSKWRLDEVVKIHKYCKRRKDHVIIPVFYDVAPSDVRRQSGSFEKDFESHCQRFGAKKVKKWRAALTDVGNLSGYDLTNEANGFFQQLGSAILPTLNRERIEADIIRRIVKDAHDKVKLIFDKNFPSQLIARDLKFPLRSHGWKWSRVREHAGAKLIKVAETRELDWVKVRGTYKMKNLKEGLTYRAQVKVMLRDNLQFDCKLKLKLIVPNTSSINLLQETKVNLMKMPRNQWVWLEFGEFKAQNVSGIIEVSMDAVSDSPKNGLIINSVRFLPTT